MPDDKSGGNARDGDFGDSENVNRPSCSNSNSRAGRGRGLPATVTRNAQSGRNRRIVMRIEFNDSDESNSEDSVDLGMRPSCSSTASSIFRSNAQAKAQAKDAISASSTEADGEEAQRLKRRRLRSRLGATRLVDESGSTSGSEIDQCRKRVRGKRHQLLVSEDESPRDELLLTGGPSHDNDGGFSSDSSSNELLEKCPICLLTFRQQEIGTPSTCEHIFCAGCIEAWSKNVQTCPIDRLAFEKIIVRDTFGQRNIIKEIHVDPSKSRKELLLEDEDVEIINLDEDVTNCEICNSPEREDVMLLCDSCNQGYHMDCLDPPLNEVPEGSWYCDNCIDSNEEYEDEALELAEDLNMLYEDIRGMGLPETRLRVRAVQQPRILRTRQNERIRAAVLRRTRNNSSVGTRNTTAQTRERSMPSATTSATSRTRTVRQRIGTRRRRKRTRHRTYVVEYDLNNFDEKFAIKTTKKVIRRRRRCTRHRRGAESGNSSGTKMTASQRLAEQMGVKVDTLHHRGSHLGRGSASSFSLFGSANDMEYFSDGDGNEAGQMDIGQSTAVQTSVRIAIGSGSRTRKSLLMGKARTAATSYQSPASDILSSILDMQDQWHNASRNFSNVHINADGSLNLPAKPVATTHNPPVGTTTKVLVSEIPKPTATPKSAEVTVTQVPLYQRGGGGPHFGRGGGNTSGGNYNNRYGSSSNYRGGDAGGVGGRGGAGVDGGNQYPRHSTGGMASNASDSSGAGNNGGNSGTGTFQPFHLRFNQRQPQQQQQQQQQKRDQNLKQHQSLPFRGSNALDVGNDRSGPGAGPETVGVGSFPSPTAQFSGLPLVPPMGVAPPTRISLPPILTVPPPPAPPPNLPWNSSLFQLHTDYANENTTSGVDNEAENCPNFSIYSQESQAVAKCSELSASEEAVPMPKDDEDINEDLVQLDDDDDIPLPPEAPDSRANNANANDLDNDLYEPENPTEEPDEDVTSSNVREIAKCPKSNSSGAYGGGDKYDPERETTSNSNSTVTNSNLEPISSDVASACKELDDEDTVTRARGTPSPTLKAEHAAAESRQKGVLELYDDSDWEELDIDKPKEFEKALEIKKVELQQKKKHEAKPPVVDVDEKKSEKGEKKKSKRHGSEPVRSYTPCLDEVHDGENVAEASLETKSDNKKSDDESQKKSATTNQLVGDMDTEMISEEDELPIENEPKRRSRSRRRNERASESKTSKQRESRKRSKESPEQFKKAGKRLKGRNYRGDKHSARSRSRTPRTPRAKRSDSSSSISTRSRSRSRVRSPRGRRKNSRSRSHSRSRSVSQSPGRGGGRQRRHSFNNPGGTRGFGHNRGVGRGGQRYNYRNSQNYQRPYQNQLPFYQRPKRRELPRYDVRNVVGNSRHQQRDRYGRDATRAERSRSGSYERHRPRSRSFSRNVSRSRSAESPKRFRSFSISPSPTPGDHRPPQHGHSLGLSHQNLRRGSSMSPGPSRRFGRSPSQPPLLRHSHSPMFLRSRSHTPPRMNGGRKLPVGNRSPLYSPRYTPRLSRSRSKTPKNLQSKKKKKKGEKKKKSKKRAASSSPTGRQRRISRQRDPFDDTDDFLAPETTKKRRHTPKKVMTASHWSPSPSLSPTTHEHHMNFIHQSGGGIMEKNTSWTPPLGSPHYTANLRHSHSPLTVSSKKIKRKRVKGKKSKKKIFDKQQRKDKKRKRRTQTPEPQPSKEVFASGNNILVSVSFNKEAASNTTAVPAQQQTTVVTLPPTRDDLLVSRRTSIDRLTNSSVGVMTTVASHKKSKKDRSRKRKKLEAKPIAIIDLERSPFQVHQEPADVIVLTDSEDANDNQMPTSRRDRRRGSVVSVGDAHSRMMAGEHGQRETTPPLAEVHLETIMETSYENISQMTGPKTPPEPPIVKFNLPAKKQHKVRNNPLLDEADDINSADELIESTRPMRVNEDLPAVHGHDGLVIGQKIGPNTPPESGPCSPDAYDPFEPTKSPSLSPRSPISPGVNIDVTLQSQPRASSSGSGGVDKSDGLAGDDLIGGGAATPAVSNASSSTNQTGNANNSAMNPVDLVMALMNKPSGTVNSQDGLQVKSCDTASQYLNNNSGGNSSGGVGGPVGEDQAEDSGNTITVLSNVLLTTGSGSQHIPVISSPTPPSTLVKKMTSLPKQGGSVASSSSGIVNLPSSSGTLRNGSGGIGATAPGLDDSFNMDIESPYSPGSADYEDLFEPPPESGTGGGSTRRSKGSGVGGSGVHPSQTGGGSSGKAEIFDNLFGSSSPVSQLRISSRFNSSTAKKSQLRINSKNDRKSKGKGGKSGDDHGKPYEDVPNSAVDLQVKDKFLRKLNRQERVVEEVKLVLKPHFNKKVITKEDYKDIMRRAVPKICHSRSGEINPHKIKNLIDAYVKKFRAKHKKLSLLNTGQVSSAVKCAAYLKKL